MRKVLLERMTRETRIRVRLNLDGSGRSRISTPLQFFNHLLAALAKHGFFDLDVTAEGDFSHHIGEDVMIVLGQAIEKALGSKTGIERMGEAIVPMDDALVLVAVDVGGRAYVDIDCKFRKKRIEDFNTDLFPHLLHTLATNAQMNLHVDVLRGSNDHHKAEAVFKALGIALRRAVRRTGKRRITSTKGVSKFNR